MGCTEQPERSFRDGRLELRTEEYELICDALNIASGNDFSSPDRDVQATIPVELARRFYKLLTILPAPE